MTSLDAFAHAPRRIPAIHTGMEKADAVAGRIAQICLTPEPGLVPGLRLELKPRGLQFAHCGVEIFELEVDNDTTISGKLRRAVQGEGGAANGALEAGVVGRAAHDLAQPERSIERHRGRQVGAGHSYLIEVHRKNTRARRKQEARKSWSQEVRIIQRATVLL